MKYKVQIHKHKIYLTPRPKEDIPGGLVIKLNKPRFRGVDPFMHTDIFAHQKEYELPELASDYFIEFVFVKNERKNKV